MSLNIFPWTLFLVMTFGFGVSILFYLIKAVKEDPKRLIMGFVILAISLISIGIVRTVENTGILEQYLPMLDKVGICILIGTPFILGGFYRKARHVPEKKRAMMILFGSVLFIAIPLVVLM